MSTPQGFGPGGPFEGGPFGDLMRSVAQIFATQGPLNWEIAMQMADWAANDGQPEANPDPVWRVRLEELLRVAEMHVAEATGLTWPSEGLTTVAAITRVEWARRTLDDWKGHFEKLASRVATPSEQTGENPVAPEQFPWPTQNQEPGGDPLASLFSSIPQILGPFLLGLQAGSMVGQLAKTAMGQFDPLMPRPFRTEIAVVTSTVQQFASEWSLPEDDVRMWICLNETFHRAVLGQQFVSDRLNALVGAYVEAFSARTDPIEARLAGVDLSDMASMQEAFGDPSTLLAEMQNDAQRSLQAQLRAILCAITGYTDFQMDAVGRRLVGSYPAMAEALRRRRLEDTRGSTMLAQLFGISMSQEDYEAGRSFVHGIVERAGEPGLARLWSSERHLPTPAELSAPGLWLARIDLPGE